jgi:hypothetical protein
MQNEVDGVLDEFRLGGPDRMRSARHLLCAYRSVFSGRAGRLLPGMEVHCGLLDRVLGIA